MRNGCASPPGRISQAEWAAGPQLLCAGGDISHHPRPAAAHSLIPAGQGSKASPQGETVTGELPSLPRGSGDAQREGDAPGCGGHSGCAGSCREGLVSEG